MPLRRWLRAAPEKGELPNKDGEGQCPPSGKAVGWQLGSLASLWERVSAEHMGWNDHISAADAFHSAGQAPGWHLGSVGPDPLHCPPPHTWSELGCHPQVPAEVPSLSLEHSALRL